MEHKSLIAFALVLQAGTKSFKDGFALISYLMAVQTHDFQRKGILQATRLRSYLTTDGNSCNQQHTSTTDPDSGQVIIVQQPVFLVVVIVYLVDMFDNLQAFPTIPTTDVILLHNTLLSKSVAIVLQGNPQSSQKFNTKVI